MIAPNTKELARMGEEKPAAEPLCADGYEEAIVGVCFDGDQPFVLYDEDRCIEILMKRDGMSYEEAGDFFGYNTLRACAYMGPGAPRFMKTVVGTAQQKREAVVALVQDGC